MAGARRTLRFFGLPRSGNHAIIYWIIRNSDKESFVFLNNCREIADPFESCGAFESGSCEKGGKAVFRSPNPETIRPPLVAPEEDKLLVLSYEEFIPVSQHDLEHVTLGFPADQIDHSFIIYRSFLNWLSSLSVLSRKYLWREHLEMQHVAYMMKAVASYCAVLGNLTKPPRNMRATAILYDEWHRSEPYRKALLDHIGYEMKLAALDEIPVYGSGSSFDRNAMKPHEMEVDQRWRRLPDDPITLDILQICLRSEIFTRLLGQVFPEDLARGRELLAEHR